MKEISEKDIENAIESAQEECSRLSVNPESTFRELFDAEIVLLLLKGCLKLKREESDVLGYQLLDTQFVGGGPKSPLTYQDGYEDRFWYGEKMSEVPKMISECPHCQGKHVWYTTGLWLGSIACENCGKSFTV